MRRSPLDSLTRVITMFDELVCTKPKKISLIQRVIHYDLMWSGNEDDCSHVDLFMITSYAICIANTSVE